MFESESFFESYPEMSSFETEQFEFGPSEWREVFSESELMDLAAEFLEIADEAELDLFLGRLIKKVGGAIGKAVQSPIGRSIGGVLKGAVGKALPMAGGALGAYFGGPLGAKIGSGLAQAAGGALGLELETLSQEDLEFEGAKQFVRFAADAVNNAVLAPSTVDPRAAAQSAAVAAAQKYAPNLLNQSTSLAGTSPRPRKAPGGNWFRRGRNIIIVNR